VGSTVEDGEHRLFAASTNLINTYVASARHSTASCQCFFGPAACQRPTTESYRRWNLLNQLFTRLKDCLEWHRRNFDGITEIALLRKTISRGSLQSPSRTWREKFIICRGERWKDRKIRRTLVRMWMKLFVAAFVVISTLSFIQELRCFGSTRNKAVIVGCVTGGQSTRRCIVDVVDWAGNTSTSIARQGSHGTSWFIMSPTLEQSTALDLIPSLSTVNDCLE